MEEIFKDVVGYEGLYQVSNLGNIKSLSRKIFNGKGYFSSKEAILESSKDRKGYLVNCLRKNNKGKIHKVHQLVAISFLNHVPCGMKLVIDHINDDKLDNRVENLQIVTNRFNARKTQDGYSSKYKGVAWSKQSKKWRVQIYTNGKNYHVGLFEKECEASVAYQNKLLSLNN